MQRRNEANIQPTSKHICSLKDLLYRLDSYFSLGDQSEKCRPGNIKAHLARTASQSQHRMRFILATCGTSHVIIVFLVRKQIGLTERVSTNNTTGASEEIARKRETTVLIRCVQSTRRAKGGYPTVKCPTLLTRPVNPAFAKLYSPLEHRVLYALTTFFSFYAERLSS